MRSPKFIAISLGIFGSLLLMGFSALSLDQTAPNLPLEDDTATIDCSAQDHNRHPDCAVSDQPTWVAVPAVETAPKPKAQASPFQDSQVKAQLQRVADMYEYQSQFPTYSYPIDAVNVRQFIPNRHIPTTLPLTGLGLGDDLSLELTLNKFQFFWGESIEATVTANLGEDSHITHADFQLVTADGKAIFTQGVAQNTVLAERHASTQIPLSEINTPEEQDFYVVAGIRSANQSDRFEIRTPLKISHNIGSVDGVSSSYIDGSHLVIPVEVSLKDGGYYLLTANLYSQTGEPLINLNIKGKFSAYDDTIELKAHYSALSAKQDEGPYHLGDFELKQLPAKPGAKRGYGKVPDKTFDVQGYPFKDYDQSAYVDPKVEAKVEFLRTLSVSQG